VLQDIIPLNNDNAPTKELQDARTRQRFILVELLLPNKHLSRGELSVIIYQLMIKYNDGSGQCNPGVKGIAEATGQSERNVRKCLLFLADVIGCLIYEKQNPGGQDNSNDYSFQLPKPCPTGQCSTGQGSNDNARPPDRKPCPPEPEPCPPASPNPVAQDRKPCPTGQTNNLNNKTEHSLEQVRSLARTTPSVSKSESKIEKAKEERKRTSEEAREEKPQPKIESVNGPIAYVSVADHDQHLQAIEHYDFLVERVRERHPAVKTVKLYVRRLNGGLAS